MTRRDGLLPLIAAAVIAAAFAVAQTAVPVEQEPHHRLTFENPYVRVLNVDFPPGYVSLFHTHSLDNVGVRLTESVTRTDTLAAQGESQTFPVGRIAFNSATPPYTHRVVNTGSNAVRILDVEIVGGIAVPGGSARDDVAGHEVVIDNAHVRVTRIRLSAGQSLPAHTHPHGWLTIDVVGPNAGHLEWHAPAAITPVAGNLTTSTEIVEVEPKPRL